MTHLGQSPCGAPVGIAAAHWGQVFGFDEWLIHPLPETCVRRGYKESPGEGRFGGRRGVFKRVALPIALTSRGERLESEAQFAPVLETRCRCDRPATVPFEIFELPPIA